LFIATESRGKDSSGIAFITDGEERKVVSVLKKPITGSAFARDKELIAALSQHKPKVIIGHCRAKTKGDASDNKNNHPIQSEETGIAVVHNGRIVDYPWRATDDDGENPFLLGKFEAEVDSETIVRLIDTLLYIPREKDGTIIPDNVEATPKDKWSLKANVSTLKAIDDAVFNMSGGQACALLDPNYPDSVFLWKVKNPLYTAWIPEHSAFVFASTQDILKSALEVSKKEYLFDYFETKSEIILPEFFGREMHDEFAMQVDFNLEAKTEKEMLSVTQIDLKPDSADYHAVTAQSQKVSADSTKKEVIVAPNRN